MTLLVKNKQVQVLEYFSKIKVNVRFHEGMELEVKCENKE